MESKKNRIPKLPVYSCLFITLVTVLYEALLHLWVSNTLVPGRFVAVLAFAGGFGGILGFLVSLITNKKAQKWVTFALTLILAVLYLMEYFIEDAYQTYMTLNTVIGGAGGVATGFLDVVVNLLGRNLWRIGLFLLPPAAYLLLADPRIISWKRRGVLAGAVAVCYLLGFFVVHQFTVDAARFTTAYSFDSAVRSLGLNMALGLETVRGSGSVQEEPGFVIETIPTEPTQQTEPDVSDPTAPTEIVYADNVMDIDFAALAETTRDYSQKAIHSYVASVKPTKQNAYTGIFEGKNLIFITAEAFTAEVIDPELTPTLYRLANEGIKFTDYYQPAWGASTTSGEFSNLVGLVPANGGGCMFEPVQQDMFLLIGKQLQKLGYSSAAYHNNDYTFYERQSTHIHLGYDKYIGYGNGMEEGVTGVWPQSDLEMVDFTLPQHLGEQPFSLYYMSVSGHSVYAVNQNAMSAKNYDKVKDLPYSEAVKCYLACNLELEYALESMVRQLEEAGIADDTVIVIAPDHYPYGLEKSSTWGNNLDCLSELYGVKCDNRYVREHSALIIWSGSIEDMDLQVDTPVYSLDILPTISNLFGVEYDSRLLIGRDVFSDAEPLVLWPDHSWKTEKGTFDTDTGVFTPAEGVEVSESYIQRIKTLVANKITYSQSVQYYDYFHFLKKAITQE